jgi:hypothetical protein
MPQDDGSWRFGELVNDNLLDMIAAQDSVGRLIDWSIGHDDDPRARVPRLSMDKAGQVTGATFRLQAAGLSAFIAGMPADVPTDSHLTLPPPVPRSSASVLLAAQHG